MKCPNCGKDLKQTVGKRERKFCNSTCRSNFWQKQQTLKKGEVKSVKISKDLNNKHSAEVVIEVQDKKNGIKDKFSSQPVKFDMVIDSIPRPIKREDEDSIDYAFRLNEWKKLNK